MPHMTLMNKLACIDIGGFILFAAACVLFLMGLQWGGTSYAWNSSVVVGLLCAGIVLFLITPFWFVRQGENALIPPRLVRDRINISVGITAFMQTGGTFTLVYFLPIWFQGIKNATPTMSGVMFLPTIISQLVAAVLCGWLGMISPRPFINTD
jgi:Fungal trichothecene efflux pump (TRI12)